MKITIEEVYCNIKVEKLKWIFLIARKINGDVVGTVKIESWQLDCPFLSYLFVKPKFRIKHI